LAIKLLIKEDSYASKEKSSKEKSSKEKSNKEKSSKEKVVLSC
jgi:hypothetical protein